MRQISWWDVYSCENANMAAQILTSKLSNILIRIIQVRTNIESTTLLLKQSNSAQLAASQTKDQDDWRLYKSL